MVWTEASAKSRWVADESELAQQSGKLVPIRLDQTDPPIGFRQIHTLDLSSWSGLSDAVELEALSLAVAHHTDADPPSQPVSKPKKREPEMTVTSVAVLPFKNLSGDSDQDYFGDGVSEDIITALSRHRWLMVIARESSFNFRDDTIDLKDVARQLGVLYLLSGSIRRGGERIRVTAKLMDANSSKQIWANRYDRVL